MHTDHELPAVMPWQGHYGIDTTQFGVTAARGLAARYLELTVEVRCVRM